MKTEVIAAFREVQAEMPDAVVSVTYEDDTASFLRDGTTTAALMDGVGTEQGQESVVIRGVASDIGTPQRGDVMTVAGDEWFVGESYLDPLGALIRIALVKSRPNVEQDNVW